MTQELLTAQQWADMSAKALADENRKILNEMIDKVINTEKDGREEQFWRHWKMVFIASAIESGQGCNEAIATSSNLIHLLNSASS